MLISTLFKHMSCTDFDRSNSALVLSLWDLSEHCPPSPPPYSGSKDLNSLEVEAVLFGKEMKSLQDKYPNNILHILTYIHVKLHTAVGCVYKHTYTLTLASAP